MKMNFTPAAVKALLNGDRAKEYGAAAGECVVTIQDGGGVAQAFQPVPEQPYDGVKRAREIARAKLLTECPLADSVEAYWD